MAESPINLLLPGVTLMLSVTAMHGATHLAVFAVYGVAVSS
ncbi:hypothetical protein [Paeniglutamicibacter sp. NPDC091659]